MAKFEDEWPDVSEDDLHLAEERKAGFPENVPPPAPTPRVVPNVMAIELAHLERENARLGDKIEDIEARLRTAQHMADNVERLRSENNGLRAKLADGAVSAEAAAAGVGHPQPNPAQVTPDFSVILWLKRHLEANLESRASGKGGHDGNGNSWAVVAIPDWDVRQKLEELEQPAQVTLTDEQDEFVALRQQVTDLLAQQQRIGTWYADGSELFGRRPVIVERVAQPPISADGGCLVATILPETPEDEAGPLVCNVCGSRGKSNRSHRPPGVKRGAYCSGKRSVPPTPPLTFETLPLLELPFSSAPTAEPDTTVQGGSLAGSVLCESGEGGEA